jgi:hypothetical protein
MGFIPDFGDLVFRDRKTDDITDGSSSSSSSSSEEEEEGGGAREVAMGGWS